MKYQLVVERSLVGCSLVLIIDIETLDGGYHRGDINQRIHPKLENTINSDNTKIR